MAWHGEKWRHERRIGNGVKLAIDGWRLAAASAYQWRNG